MKRPEIDMTDAVGEMIEDMRELVATMKAGGMAAVRKKFTVRGGVAVPPPPAVGPADVTAARKAVGVGQSVFAELLGASLAAVRAWEEGTKTPPPMARRLLAEVAADPARWRAKLAPA